MQDYLFPFSENPGLLIIAGLAFLMIFLFISSRKRTPGKISTIISESLLLPKKSKFTLSKITVESSGKKIIYDRIILTQFGIFIIDYQKYHGEISGDEQLPIWQQKRGKKFVSFHNPMRHYPKKIEALAGLISVSPSSIFVVSVFPKTTSFALGMPENIVLGHSYIQYIKSKKIPLFGDHELRELKERICERGIAPHLKQNQSDIHSNNRQPGYHFEPQGPGAAVRFIFIKLPLIFFVLISFIIISIYFKPELLNHLPPGDLTFYLQNNLPTHENSNGKIIDLPQEDSKTAHPPIIDSLVKALGKSEQNNDKVEGSTDSGSPQPERYVYIIELNSGGWLTSEKITVREDEVEYKEKNGLLITLKRDEIKSLKRVKEGN